MEASDFNKLYLHDCSEHIEKKKTAQNRELSYLSWAWAWGYFKQFYPNANYEVIKFDGLPYISDAVLGIMVYTRVTVEDETGDKLTHEMWLPVMDSANKAMKLEPYQYTTVVWENGQKKNVVKTVKAADMFDINKTIMRCLVKNLAMFGLGLSIYAGEDIPQPLTDEEEAALAEDYQREHGAPAGEQKPTTTRKRTTTKKTDLPPQTEAAAAAPAPAAEQKREVKHISMADKDAIQQVIDWTMRQPDTNAAIQRISIGYDWEQDALDYVIAQVKERFAFINDLHGQN